jgi:hypothetical protein
MKKVSIVLIFLFLLTGIARADKITLGPADFVDDTGAANALDMTNRAYLIKTTAWGYLYAPVHLPDGAIIKSVTVVYYDNDSDSIYWYMGRANKYDGTVDYLFTDYTPGAVDSIRTSVDSSCSPAASYRKVYNGPCHYWVELRFYSVTTDLRVYGVIIDYDMP